MPSGLIVQTCDSSVHRDALVSIPKSTHTDYVGELSTTRLDVLEGVLRVALDMEYVR